MKRLSDEDRSTLGKRLRERRKVLGLTQLATSSRLAVPLHTLTNWETGQAIPRLTQVQKILDFLGGAPSGEAAEN